MPMLSLSNYKEANKKPVRDGKHGGSIKSHEKVSGKMHKQYTGSRKQRRETQDRREHMQN